MWELQSNSCSGSLSSASYALETEITYSYQLGQQTQQMERISQSFYYPWNKNNIHEYHLTPLITYRNTESNLMTYWNKSEQKLLIKMVVFVR